MKTNGLNKELLEYYYSKSFHKFKTGMDKITRQNFSTIKDEEFEIILKKVSNHKYKFTKLKHIKLSDNRIVYIPTIRDRLVLDYLKDNLNSKYHIIYKDRDTIIETLKSKLSIPMDYYILRIDIKNFFNSIPHNKLLQKLKKGSLISASDYHLVKELLKTMNSGIPQGLPISNPLSEIYLEEFDFEMKRIDQRINYYCRYVDDIVLIFNGVFTNQERINIRQKIEDLLHFFGLKLNNNKFIETPLNQSKNINFEYLGYELTVKDNKLHTSIARKKVDKLVRNINESFNEFIKEKKVNGVDNANLLIERLNYFTKYQFVIKKEKIIELPSMREYYKLKKISSGFLKSYKLADVNYIERVCKEVDDLIKKRNYALRHIITLRDSKRILNSVSMYRNYKESKTIPISRFTTEDYRKRIKFIYPTISDVRLASLTFNELERCYFKLLDFKR